jgi:hypothetical protein
MAGAECLLLNLPDREVSSEPFPKGGRAHAERIREHELPDIVQHPCGRDFRQHLRRSAMVRCDGVRAPAHACGVPGQRIHVVPALTIALESEEDLHREDQASDGVQPQELHSVTAGRDLLRAPEESRIGQLQQLGRHAQVTLDDGSHPRCRASGESNSDSTSRYTVETVGSVLSLVASSFRRASDSSVLSANACALLSAARPAHTACSNTDAPPPRRASATLFRMPRQHDPDDPRMPFDEPLEQATPSMPGIRMSVTTTSTP